MRTESSGDWPCRDVFQEMLLEERELSESCETRIIMRGRNLLNGHATNSVQHNIGFTEVLELVVLVLL